jgi:hypothetical protein
MAKIHLAAGKFGLAECGKQNVDTSERPDEITCKSCQKTGAWRLLHREPTQARD